MEKIAFLLPETGQPVYWRAILLVMGVLCAVFSLLAARLWQKRSVLPVLFLTPFAAAAAVYCGRLVHWYCCFEDYESLAAAMRRLDQGEFSLIGCIAAVLAVFLLARAVRLIRDLPALLDDAAFAACLGIGVGRMAELFSVADHGKLLITEAALQRLPVAAPVINTVSDQVEWRFATFAFQSLAAAAIWLILLAAALVRRRNKGAGERSGTSFGLFLTLYSLSQILLDSTRYDALFLRSNGFVSMEQIVCLVTMVVVMTVYTVRCVKAHRRPWRWILCWLVFLGGFGLVGYMEYFIQRHGDRFLFSYGLMSLGLLIVFLAMRVMAHARRPDEGPGETDIPIEQ